MEDTHTRTPPGDIPKGILQRTPPEGSTLTKNSRRAIRRTTHITPKRITPRTTESFVF